MSTREEANVEPFPVANERHGAMEDAERIDSDTLDNTAATRKLCAMVREKRPKVGALVFVIGETGMGKTYAARKATEVMASRNAITKWLSLAGQTSKRVVATLVQQTRNVTLRARGAQPAGMLVLDDYPPTDECDLLRQSNAIRKLVSSGVFVCVCMRPEAVQLAEEMSEGLQIRSHLMRLGMRESSGENERTNLAHGIPALHQALMEDRADKVEPHRVGSAYQLVLRRLAVSHLRPTLLVEEVELRLAMVLLGEGTAEDLMAIVSRMDPEALAWHREEAPLFGIDAASRTFSVAGYVSDEYLRPALPSLGSACDCASRVARGASIALARRGDYRRSALVATLAEPRERVGLVSTWGVEYLCMGACTMVREAIGTARQYGMESCEGMVDVCAALRLLEAPASAIAEDATMPGAPHSGGNASFATWEDVTQRRRHLELIRACRELDCGAKPAVLPVPSPDDDELSHAFLRHLEARSLLLSGELSRAYDLLVDDAHHMEVDSLPAAWICDDYEVAAVLLGEYPGGRESLSFRRAQAFLCGLGIIRIGVYRSVLDGWVATLAGRQDSVEGIEHAMAYADHMGDVAVRTCLLVGAAICDLRRRQYPRAHVRALQASEASAWMCPYLSQVSLLVDALSHLGVGDDGPLVDLASTSEGATPVMLLAAELARACGHRDELLPMREEVPAPGNGLDRDVLWLLNVLCNDLGELSLAFRSQVPDSWTWASRRSARKADSLSRSLELPAPITQPRRASSAEGTHISMRQTDDLPIRIRMLGGFQVSVRGQVLTPPTLARRRAAALIACLAAHEQHRMSRLQIVESIWPESNYTDALQRLYEATSKARIALGSQVMGVDPFISNRGEGVLGLNVACMTIDIDDFVRKARHALAARDDETVLERATDAIDVYAGDLYVSTYDARGIQSSRRHELQELFADVSVAASRSALNQDRVTLAARLARRAYDTCLMREDVVLALIEALKVQGAHQEAREVYEDYTQRLIELADMIPSLNLRHAVEDSFPRIADGRRDMRIEEEQVLTAIG